MLENKLKKLKNRIQIIFIFIILLIVSVGCDKVRGVSISKKELSMNIGDVDTLTSKIKTKSHAKYVMWVTSNSDVADIEVINTFDGEICIVTAKSEGTATIAVITEEGGYTATCKVEVTFNPIEPEMLFVEGGTFMMGSNHYNFEQPIHQVTLSSFNIAKYPITQKEWKAIMVHIPTYTIGDNLPIENVNWIEAEEYITRLNNATGKNYRLATEAEWEYAAGGGNKSRGCIYSGSNIIDEVAWYISNTNLDGPRPVGTKAPNELGIYDMSGNVWEWCGDWYGYYSDTPQINPSGPKTGEKKIIRGGGCAYADVCRVTMRLGRNPQNDVSGAGFRLVLPTQE